jgi:hypothetical protein
MVGHASEYRWSSHHAYADARSEPWLTTDFALRMFSGDRARAISAYLKFVGVSADEVPSPFERARAEPFEALGDEDFVARISRDLTVRARPTLTLEQLLDAGCQKFGLTRALLESKLRKPVLAEARAWIARRAVDERISTLSEVGRAIG